LEIIVKYFIEIDPISGFVLVFYAMKKVGFVYDDAFLRHETPEWHPESKERLISIISALKGSDIWEKLIHIKPRKAAFPDIEKVHMKQYVENIKRHAPGYLDPDTYLSAGSLDAALFAAGALLEALDRCKSGGIERAFCAVRPPGHHAEADRAMGFCIFNNVAVAARYAQGIGYKKVFIVDFDVHHGNGTQHAFDNDGTVFYFSTHQYPHYPGTGGADEKGIMAGRGFTYNIPMAAGSGDKEYISIYRDILPSLLSNFNADCILVSAGYDIHSGDPLSQIHVSTEGVRNIVMSIVSGQEIPIVFALEGGYNLNALSESVSVTLRELLEII
jgi:acetoin utilization deacetylase AcuC-like enzyme